MGFKCAIVGLPNVGKSTLFNALTNAGIAAQNYPFCTIEPNVGIVFVPDVRLHKIAALAKPEKVIPTTIEFVDIAGLVAGAAQGEGLGNKFLAHIRDTDAIAQVVRCFDSDDIIHVAGKIDPISDIETIQTELALADLETLLRVKQRVERKAKTGDKESQFEMNIVEKCEKQVNEGLPIRQLSFTETELALLKTWNLLTAKPTLYVANVAEDGFANNPYLDSVRAFAEKENANIVVISAALEAEMMELTYQEKQELLSAYGQDEPGLDRLIRAGYALLGLQTYFTAGEKEVRAWTFEKNSTAPIAAGKIHTDFTKGFIRAEVIAYEDFIQYKGEQGAKDAGKWRLEGKEYIVQDGDLMHFRFNV